MKEKLPAKFDKLFNVFEKIFIKFKSFKTSFKGIILLIIVFENKLSISSKLFWYKTDFCLTPVILNSRIIQKKYKKLNNIKNTIIKARISLNLILKKLLI